MEIDDFNQVRITLSEADWNKLVNGEELKIYLGNKKIENLFLQYDPKS